MTTADVALVIQRALENLPKGVAKPRIISDNGPQYLSTGFRSCLRDQEVVHSRIRVGHPQSNGKMERFHKTLKSECVRTQALGGFEEVRKIIRTTVHEYNHERLHSALNYLTPSTTSKGKSTSNSDWWNGRPPWSKPDRIVAKKKPALSGSRVSLTGTIQKSAIFVDKAHSHWERFPCRPDRRVSEVRRRCFSTSATAPFAPDSVRTVGGFVDFQCSAQGRLPFAGFREPLSDPEKDRIDGSDRKPGEDRRFGRRQVHGEASHKMAESRLGDFRKREVTILSVHIGRVAIFSPLFFTKTLL